MVKHLGLSTAGRARRREGKEGREGKKCFGGSRKWSSYGNVTRMTMLERPPPHRSYGLQCLESVLKAIKEGSMEKKHSSFSLLFPSDLLPVPPTAQTLFKAIEPRDLHDTV